MHGAPGSGTLLRVPEDHSADDAAAAIRTIAGLLERYGAGGRAEFVRSVRDDETGEIDWSTVAGLEFWGGAGAIWEIEPFEFSHPAEERSADDSRGFYSALLCVAETLEARGMAELSHRNLDLLRKMAAAR